MACFHVNRELVVKGHISMYTLQGIDGEWACFPVYGGLVVKWHVSM